jgi:hypothetical protein
VVGRGWRVGVEKCVLGFFFGVGFVLGLVDVWVRLELSVFVFERCGWFRGGLVCCCLVVVWF